MKPSDCRECRPRHSVRKILSIILSLCILFNITAGIDFSAYSATLASSGSCGTNVTYMFDSSTGKLVISGTGAMPDYYFSSSPFYNQSSIKTVVINSDVTSIGKYAFNGCTGLTSVTIPDNVTSIGEYAFRGCTSLASVTISNSVTSIGKGAFYDCSSLEYLYIDSASYLNYVGDTAFWCKNLKSISNPNVFEKLDNIEDVFYPGGLIYNNLHIFANCDSAQNTYYSDFYWRKIKVSDTISRNGYDLIGLAETSNGEVIYNYDDEIDFTKSMDLYAVWKEKTKIKIRFHFQRRIYSEGERHEGDIINTEDFTISKDTQNFYGVTFRYWSLEPCGEPVSKQIVCGKNDVDLYAVCYLNCEICKGDGRVQASDIGVTSSKCPKCSGGGSVTSINAGTCSVCNGTGVQNVIYKVNCISCNGKKYTAPGVVCIMCNGVGQITCYSRKCVNCSGTGKVSLVSGCSYCNGTGNFQPYDCTACKKTGIVKTDNTHAFCEWYITKEPTCSYEGELQRHCIMCNESETKAIETIGHTPYYQVEILPTCTETGATAGSICSVCNKVLKEREIIPKKDHSYTSVVTKQPTCTKTGIRTFTCSACGDTNTNKIPIVEHNAVTDNAVAPTCTTDGLTEGSHCSVCGTILVVQTVISATGHNSESMNNAVAPTCTTAGKESDTKCSICGVVLIEQQIISAKGHKYELFRTTATCEKAGYDVYKCSVCSGTKSEKVDAHHTCDTFVGVVDGELNYSCSACGKEYTKSASEIFEKWDSGAINASAEEHPELDVVNDGKINAKDYAMLLHISK